MGGFVGKDEGSFLDAPVRQEIMTHLGEKGVLDGDALLWLCLNASHGGIDLAHGGQMVHVVELCERQLKSFCRLNAKIFVAWFDDAEGTFWANNPFALLARRVVRAHLANQKFKPSDRTRPWRAHSGRVTRSSSIRPGC